MLREIVSFEMRYQLRGSVFWSGAVLLVALGFLAISVDGLMLSGTRGDIFANAPYAITHALLMISLASSFWAGASLTEAALRDDDLRVGEIFGALPGGWRRSTDGRLLGALTLAVFVGLLPALGMAAGSSMSWVAHEDLAPVRWLPYLSAHAWFVIPNVLIAAGVASGLALLSRSWLRASLGVAGLYLSHFVARGLRLNPGSEVWAALADPFGWVAFRLATQHWTVVERNTQALVFDSSMLANRVLWLTVAGGLIAVARSWSGAAVWDSHAARRSYQPDEETREGNDIQQGRSLRPTVITVSAAHRFQALPVWWESARSAVRGIVTSRAFPLIYLVFGISVCLQASTVNRLHGTPVYPVTLLMVQAVQNSFFFVILIIGLYAGHLVWRDRQLRLHHLLDAMPVPDWVCWSSRLAALGVIVLGFLATALLAGVAFQAAHGYYRFEVGLYFKALFLIVGIPFFHLAVLAVFLQVVARNRFLGYGLFLLLIVSDPVLEAWGLDHHLLRYVSGPDPSYSDMNGYGYAAWPAFLFRLYRSLIAVLLVVVIHLAWPRGNELGWRATVKRARHLWTRRVRTCFFLAGLGAAACAGFIFYNTNVLNESVSAGRRERRLTTYERKYKRFERQAMPKVRAVYTQVDLFPHQRALAIHGRYTLENDTHDDLAELHVRLRPGATVESLVVPGAELRRADEETGYRVYALRPALRPGNRLTMSFNLRVQERGFDRRGRTGQLVRNGLIFGNRSYFPGIGYDPEEELNERKLRARSGLPDRQPPPAPTAPAARARGHATHESDWIALETVVSTRHDQVALAPGRLVREWRSGGRRYFHYRTETPTPWEWTCLSGRWVVARDRWRGVAIEIYSHPDHPQNVRRMLDAARRSLEFCASSFGAYPFEHLRIVEFPRYRRYNRALPGLIVCVEDIAFIIRLDADNSPVDFLTFLVAHEVAHQWWGLQVSPGYSAGYPLIVESLAQYAALMVLERAYGEEHVGRFLRYEMDSYLRGRGSRHEPPLNLVTDQSHVFLHKGGLSMYALRRMAGAETVNRALGDFFRTYKYQGPPYPTSQDLLAHLKRALPSEQTPVVRDLFEAVSLYENRMRQASYCRTSDGSFLVRLEVEIHRRQQDGDGRELEAPFREPIDVAVYGERSGKEDLVVRQRPTLRDGRQWIEMKVPWRPRRAAVDPLNTLIDRDLSDNSAIVEAAGGACWPGLP